MNTRVHETQSHAELSQGQPPKVFLRPTIDGLLGRLESLIQGGGRSLFRVSNFWQGELRWARNRASMTSDRRDTNVIVYRWISGGFGSAEINQIDEVSLTSAIRSAERRALQTANHKPTDMERDLPTLSAMSTTTWSDATLARTMSECAKFVYTVTSDVERNQLLSAGYLESRGLAVGSLSIDEYGRKSSWYGQLTQAQCSTTVRHPQGTSSGWAGLSGYDISVIDEEALAKRALDKCIAMLNPVRIEPGRYTTILEPQAVADLTEVLIRSLIRRIPEGPSGPASPFFLDIDTALERNRSKLGQRMIDARITISHDPSDPLLGILPATDANQVVWFDHGVLQGLGYPRYYALNELNDNESMSHRLAYRMAGGTTSVDDMIAGTKRGLIVTRFSSIRMVDGKSLLSTGLTRDGLWLVENGRISKAVRNFRFTESPLFALNNVVDLGVPVPVFRPNQSPETVSENIMNALSPAIVPALKVDDFSFTSTIDAV